MTCSYNWMDYVYFGLMCAVIVLLMVYIIYCLRHAFTRSSNHDGSGHHASSD
jgi:intracellular septation protein A